MAGVIIFIFWWLYSGEIRQWIVNTALAIDEARANRDAASQEQGE